MLFTGWPSPKSAFGTHPSAIENLETVIHLKPGFQLAYVKLARLYLRSFQLKNYWQTIKRGVAFK